MLQNYTRKQEAYIFISSVQPKYNSPAEERQLPVGEINITA